MAITSRRSGPKTKRLARERMYRLIFEQTLEFDTYYLEAARRVVPDAWHMIEMDVEVDEPKDKLTLYLDRSVVKVFRAMGHGYQARINRVLTTWVQMKMADISAHEMGYVEAIEATKAEQDAEAPEDFRERRAESLDEHWAYLQGFLDAEMRFR